MEKEPRYNLDIATAEQKEKIKEIATLRIGAGIKAELILVLLGVKNATELTVNTWNDPPEKVEGVLADSKLIFKKITFNKENKNVLSSYTISLTQEKADKLAEVDGLEDHQAVGELYSFPQTAIDAFVNSTKLELEDYPDMKGIIFLFALSKDHWQEEVELLKYWSQLIEKYAPELFVELGGKKYPPEADQPLAGK